MKKIYIALVFVSYQSFSQDVLRSSTAYTQVNFTLTTNDAIPEETQTKVLLKRNGAYVKAYLNNIPSAVMIDFTKRYENAEGVLWKVDDNEISGHFNFNNEKITVIYKKNGYLLSTRKTYDSTKLDKELKQLIRNEIEKGYRVGTITEVINETVTLYEISLEHQFKICVIRISRNKGAGALLDEKVFFTKADPGNI